VIVIVFVAVTLLHPPAASIVFETVYVPGVLAERSTWPVEVLTKTSPDVEEKTPAFPPPLNKGKGSDAFEQ